MDALAINFTSKGKIVYSTKTLGFRLSTDGLSAVIADDDLSDVGELRGTVPENVLALSEEIRSRYNAPLIVLGRLEEFRGTSPLWATIYEGEHQKHTLDEITDLTHSLQFKG
jgi:hypothetical protein